MGHVLRKGGDSITRTANRWTREGKRIGRRGLSKSTRGRTVEAELEDLGHSCRRHGGTGQRQDGVEERARCSKDQRRSKNVNSK